MTMSNEWRDYVSWLAWERLGIPPEELDEANVKWVVWISLLNSQSSPSDAAELWECQIKTSCYYKNTLNRNTQHFGIDYFITWGVNLKERFKIHDSIIDFLLCWPAALW